MSSSDLKPVELAYADIERVLARLNRIADDKRTAFKARLKHLQRLGFPTGANTGTGKRAVYDADMLFQLVMAVELIQCGLPPKLIVTVLKDNWRATQHGLLFAMVSDELFERLPPYLESSDLAWIIQPEALRELSTEGVGEFDFKEAVSIKPVSDLSDYFVKQREWGIVVGDGHRHIVVHLRELAGRLFRELDAVRPDITGGDVVYEFLARFEHHQERMRELSAIFDEKLTSPEAERPPAPKPRPQKRSPTLFERMASLSKDGGGDDSANDQEPRDEVKRGNS